MRDCSKIGKEDSVLMFAPHSDDEVLAMGGIIQQYLQSGSSVNVAILTNGDGQLRRPPFLPFPRADFVKLGYRRQKETMSALNFLGLEEDNVDFFGYPDRGLDNMWRKFWDPDELYFSKYTRSDHSPYKNSYSDQAPYCGSAIVEDVKNLLLEVQPETVYLPHPNDSHPDHWSTNGFVLYGLEQLKNEGHSHFEEVTTLSYLVHRGKFPSPRGKNLSASLLPARDLQKLDTTWKKILLNAEQRFKKLEAIRKYRSQTQIMKKYLFSFARANELFGIVPTLTLNHPTNFPESHNAAHTLSRASGEAEDKALLNYLDPKSRSRIASIKRYPDIKSVSLNKEQQELTLFINFFNRYRSGNEVQIHLKVIEHCNKGTKEVQVLQFQNGQLLHNKTNLSKGAYSYRVNPRSVRLSIPLEKLGNPTKLILSIIMARKGVPFARTANRLIKIA